MQPPARSNRHVDMALLSPVRTVPARRWSVTAFVLAVLISGSAVMTASAVAGTTDPKSALLAGLPPLQPANTVDPGLPGKYQTAEGEYDLPEAAIPDVEKPVEMKALVIAPKGVTTKRPVVVFLHGSHSRVPAGAQLSRVPIDAAVARHAGVSDDLPVGQRDQRAGWTG
jgi:hypothetical protein